MVIILTFVSPEYFPIFLLLIAEKQLFCGTLLVFEVPLGLWIYDASFSPITPCTTKVMYVKWLF